MLTTIVAIGRQCYKEDSYAIGMNINEEAMKGAIKSMTCRSLTPPECVVQPQRPPAAQPQRRLSPATILLVDDDPDLLLALADALRFWLAPITIDTSLSPHEALQSLCVAPDRYQIIATDFRMPHMDGLTFLRRARGLCPTVPIVLMTAYDLEFCSREASTLGAYETIRKPFERAEMIALFQRALHTAA